MAFLDERVVASRPHPVFWAGFKSNTWALQQAGWEFSMQQDPAYDRIGMVMRNRQFGMRAGSVGISYYNLENGIRDPNNLQPFQVNWMTNADIGYRVMEQVNISPYIEEYRPVDARPQVVAVRDFDDLNIFAGAPLARTQEIIIDPDDVSAMMDRILELQRPGREAHYKEMVREASRAGNIPQAVPRQNFHAQILSFAA